MSDDTTPEQDKAQNVRSPEIANKIEIVRNKDNIYIFINGESLPWHIAREPITTRINSDHIATVRLTLLADHVVLTDGIY